MKCVLAGLLLAFALLLPIGASAEQIDRQAVERLFAAETPNVEALHQLGPEVLPLMAQLYSAADESKRALIAQAFYQLGWKSPEAEQALMQDAHTGNPALRLQVQWALGRVSDAPEVVDVLLQNMRFDQNPLFRDKAACALANDQIHLNPRQKLRLFEGLIDGLASDIAQVRSISIQALAIQTGQRKGYNPQGTAAQRAAQVQEWKQWLEEYRSSL